MLHTRMQAHAHTLTCMHQPVPGGTIAYPPAYANVLQCNAGSMSALQLMELIIPLLLIIIIITLFAYQQTSNNIFLLVLRNIATHGCTHTHTHTHTRTHAHTHTHTHRKASEIKQGRSTVRRIDDHLHLLYSPA